MKEKEKKILYSILVGITFGTIGAIVMLLTFLSDMAKGYSCSYFLTNTWSRTVLDLGVMSFCGLLVFIITKVVNKKGKGGDICGLTLLAGIFLGATAVTLLLHASFCHPEAEFITGDVFVSAVILGLTIVLMEVLMIVMIGIMIVIFEEFKKIIPKMISKIRVRIRVTLKPLFDFPHRFAGWLCTALVMLNISSFLEPPLFYMLFTWGGIAFAVAIRYLILEEKFRQIFGGYPLIGDATRQRWFATENRWVTMEERCIEVLQFLAEQFRADEFDFTEPSATALRAADRLALKFGVAPL